MFTTINIRSEPLHQWNDNYDGNFDDNDDKNYQKCYDFWVKINKIYEPE